MDVLTLSETHIIARENLLKISTKFLDITLNIEIEVSVYRDDVILGGTASVAGHL